MTLDGDSKVLTDGGVGGRLDTDTDQAADVAATIDPATAETLLNQASEPATWGELRRAVAEADMLDVDDPGAAVDDALDRGVLVEENGAGAFPTLRLAAAESGDEKAASTPRERPEAVTRDEADGDTSTHEPATRGGYRALYLEAHQRAGADRAFVPHEDLAPVFGAYGFGDVVDDLRYQSEWVVWTPENRDTPLYVYTPDLAGDTSAQRAAFADLLAEAGVGRERFIDVLDGQKASFDTAEARAPEDPEIAGNYGVKGGRGGDESGLWLVDVDVDDYDDAKDSNAAVEELREQTTAVASAHTTRDRPGHLYVAVDGDPRDIVAELVGRDVSNAIASFGEVRIDNQYVLGPGSRVLCGCDRCTADDAPAHLGQYQLANDDPPVVWSEDEFRAFLLADPAIERQAEQAEQRDDQGDDTGDGADTGSTADPDGWLALARDADDYVADAIREARSPDDRSEADSALARAVAPWLNYDRSAIADALNDHGTGKWAHRGDSYRDSVLDYAIDRRTSVDAYRPLPYWALVEAAVTTGVVERDQLVERDSDTGAVVDSADNWDTYTALPSGSYNDALAAVREQYDVDPGREPVDTGSQSAADRDPRDAAVVLDPGRAWRAAGLVEPADLPDDHSLPTTATDDGPAFACSDCGEPVDIVRAAALNAGLVETCDANLGDDYADAYAAARDDHGAPLPRYVTAAEAVADYDTVLGAVRELDFHHLDRDALMADVTGEGDDVAGDAVLTLDPTPVDGWRDSESGDSVVVYPSGTVYDADAGDGEDRGTALDALRFVALDSGVLDDPTDTWGDGDFAEAYRIAREVYGAPLPRWYAAEARDPDADRVPFVPDLDDLLDDDAAALASDDSGDDLDDVRGDVGELVREATDTDDVDPDRVIVVGALPATGKTTVTIRQAGDQPTTYLVPRLDLQAQAVEKAQRYGVSYDVLPVFSDGAVAEGAVEQAVAHVREHGKRALRERWRLVEAVGGDVLATDDQPDTEDDDTDDIDLDRETCPTAAGEHGAAWALAVETARALGHRPREIHRDAVGLFGAPLPCTCDEADDTDDGAATCRYSAAWDEVNDREDPADLLIGSYGHAHVEGVRTYRTGSRDDPEDPPRAVVLDEFPGDAFTTDYGPEAFGFATWLATALVDDVEARADVTPALADNGLLLAWLDGTITDDYPGVQAAKTALRDRRTAVEAVETAREVRERYDDLDALDLDDPLAGVVATWDDTDGAPGPATLRAAAHDLLPALDSIRPTDDATPIARWVRDDVLNPLLDLGDQLAPDPDALPFPDDGGLREVIDHALDASATRDDGATVALGAAERALDGGADGCRELATWSDDGHAHPDAAHLLRGVITPPDDDRTVRVGSDSLEYPNPGEPGDGTVLKQVALDERTTVVVDENRQGAAILDPPERHAAGGDTCPLVGLDATARPELWAFALGARGDPDAVDVVDVHDGWRERAAFLDGHLDVTIARMSDRARPYSGDPDGKDTDGDVAMVEHLADTFAGTYGPRERDAEPVTVDDPAVITSKAVEGVLDGDDRLDGKVSTFAHYGDLDGRNDLGEYELAALLGTPHFGDHYIERVAAFCGEEVDTSRETGRGMNLDYGSSIANAALRGMREDRVAQAILRFARGDSGAVVYARTAALRDDLPVRGEGQVAKTYSANATKIAEAAAALDQDRERFTTADVRERLGDDAPSARTVRRTLAELATAGYVERERPGEGTAFGYDRATTPGAGEVEAPDVAGEGIGTYPDKTRKGTYYTASVRVVPPGRLLDRGDPGGRDQPGRLPAPGTAPERAAAGTGPPG